ncbi:MAG: hypothetical protein U1E23_14710 [Reyranellaceae bacterium]
MSRTLTTAMGNAIVAPTVRPILLFDATLADDSVVYYFTGYGTVTWNGHTYLGTGQLIAIDKVDETDDVKAQGTQVTVNGVPSSQVSLFLQSLANGKTGIVRLAMLDNAGSIVATPKVLFKGLLDTAKADESNLEAPVFGLTYEHALVDLERPREVRYTHEAQQAAYPGDLGLQYIAELQDKVVEFGKNWFTPR